MRNVSERGPRAATGFTPAPAAQPQSCKKYAANP